MIGPLRESDAARFWAKVEKTDGCWLWRGARDPEGYGNFSTCVDGKLRYHRAHRFAYVLATGAEIPDGAVVAHRCDNPPCVRPDHLWPATPRENTRDMVEKGRQVVAARRIDVCRQGHAFDGHNGRQRTCSVCDRAKHARYRARRRAAA